MLLFCGIMTEILKWGTIMVAVVAATMDPLSMVVQMV